MHASENIQDIPGAVGIASMNDTTSSEVRESRKILTDRWK
jgi:hypothetical protein